MTLINPLAIFFHIFPFGIQGIMALATIFWIWVIIDCLTKEPSEGNDKLAWLIFIIAMPPIGAIVYYVVRRPERVKAVGR